MRIKKKIEEPGQNLPEPNTTRMKGNNSLGPAGWAGVYYQNANSLCSTEITSNCAFESMVPIFITRALIRMLLFDESDHMVITLTLKVKNDDGRYLVRREHFRTRLRLTGDHINRKVLLDLFQRDVQGKSATHVSGPCFCVNHLKQRTGKMAIKYPAIPFTPLDAFKVCFSNSTGYPVFGFISGYHKNFWSRSSFIPFQLIQKRTGIIYIICL